MAALKASLGMAGKEADERKPAIAAESAAKPEAAAEEAPKKKTAKKK
jgi:hypothetical protein